jgi:uncharacterized membrane protein
MLPEGTAASWLSSLEESGIATALRTSVWAYPAVETLHILGFVVLVGAAAMFDLRLLGVSKNLPISGLARHLLRWSQASAFIVVPTGLLLFSAEATTLAFSGVFRVKLVLVALAGINAAIFHRYTSRSVHSWDRGEPAPPAARAAAFISLLLWAGVITCGRLIAYL